MARQVQGIAKPGKSARGDVRQKRVQSSLLQSGARPADSQGEKGLFCKIEFHDLQKQSFFGALVSKFAGKTLLGVTERSANYAKLLFCIIGRR